MYKSIAIEMTWRNAASLASEISEATLIVFNPASAQDEYFRELERLFSAASLDAGALASLQKRYDQELVSLDR